MQPEIVAALIGVGGVVLGSVISYQLGKRQNVDRDLLARRIEVTTAVRSRIREISILTEDIAKMDPKYLPYLHERKLSLYKEATQMIDDLADYYARYKPWLPEEARSIVENFIAEPVFQRPEGPYEITDFDISMVQAAAENFRNHLDEFDRHVSSVLGTQRPWWRRIFGQ